MAGHPDQSVMSFRTVRMLFHRVLGHSDFFICHSDRREESKRRAVQVNHAINTVVPAKAGIQEIPGEKQAGYREFWIPAFAGTTVAWIAGQPLEPDGNTIAGPPAQVLKLRILRRLENQPPVNPETL